MKGRPNKYRLLFITSLFSLIVLASSASAGPVKASFLYNLSNFTGPIPFSWAKVSIDSDANEIYVADTSDDSIRIFNKNGMEVYSFNDDGSLGVVLDAAIGKNGNMLLLSYQANAKYFVILCNYRGELISRIEPKDLPKNFTNFYPTAIVYREGHIYFADKQAMNIVVTDEQGVYERHYDIGSLLGLDEKKKDNVDIRGFSVDHQGNILFTIPVLFHAYMLSPDGKLTAFGQRGSAPGKFNITAGIAADERGNYYVADTLKCAVLVFDKEFKFVTQFGYRGYDPGGLIAPMGLAIHDGRLYVSQSARKGVSVFDIHYD